MITIFIRKLESKAHEYFAYLKGPHGKGTYLLYFTDDIYGAIALSNFVQMLKGHFESEQIAIELKEREIAIKSQALLEVLQDVKKESEKNDTD
jgi:hypothetical protein